MKPLMLFIFCFIDQVNCVCMHVYFQQLFVSMRGKRCVCVSACVCAPA